jgi:hypothetical protein
MRRASEDEPEGETREDLRGGKFIYPNKVMKNGKNRRGTIGTLLTYIALTVKRK